VKLVLIKRRPTAAICSADEEVKYVLGRLSTQGWCLPQDLSVVGFDVIHLGAYSYLPLTTIGQPEQVIAQIAVERLQYLLKSHDEPVIHTPLHQEIVPTLLLHSSTMAI
jgi:DNA-binding LacI/PurR family transcriptional regulator